jgi:50S ribosomal protein L16 3-hydroxylase
MSDKKNILGEVTPQDFLSNHWQRAPLLVRSALPDYVSPITPDELAGLALDHDVESRIVMRHGEQQWELRHGPFREEDFTNLPESDWTLLVQALDLWVPEAQSLLHRFDFLPRWRLDDIMASYATKGGSVGPHYDHYDVFLLQVEGQRRWQIGEDCNANTARVAGTDLRIVQDFSPTQEWLLNPGDMLYLPPGLSHWGVAESECLTFSVGFRSPSLADMLGELAIELSAQDNDDHFSDPRLSPDMAGDEIHPAFIAQAKKLLQAALSDDGVIEDCFARYMTASKYPGLEEQTGERRVASIGGRRYCNGELVD